jgi:hypothetical protein
MLRALTSLRPRRLKSPTTDSGKLFATLSLSILDVALRKTVNAVKIKNGASFRQGLPEAMDGESLSDPCDM